MTVSSFLFGQAYAITIALLVLFNLLGLCVVTGARELGYLPHFSTKIEWWQWVVFVVFSLIPFLNILYLALTALVVCVFTYHIARIHQFNQKLDELARARHKAISQRIWSAE